MRRVLLVITVVAALAGTAEALTIRDIIELTRSGLGEEVLLALIEVDRGVYAIDTATLKQLKAAGVSDRVIVALVRSGRELPVEPIAPPPTEEQPPAPQVVVIDHDHPTIERIREVPVAVPVYIPVMTTRFRHHRQVESVQDTSPAFVPFQSGPPRGEHVDPQKTAPPVYWGFGGKLRPDAWDPTPPVRPPDRRK